MLLLTLSLFFSGGDSTGNVWDRTGFFCCPFFPPLLPVLPFLLSSPVSHSYVSNPVSSFEFTIVGCRSYPPSLTSFFTSRRLPHGPLRRIPSRPPKSDVHSTWSRVQRDPTHRHDPLRNFHHSQLHFTRVEMERREVVALPNSFDTWW